MKKAIRNVHDQTLSLLIRKEILLTFIKLLLSNYWNYLKWRDLSCPHILFSIHPYKKPKNTEYYVRKSIPWKYGVRGLCTPDKLLFKTKRISCTDSRNCVPTGQMHSLPRQPPFFLLVLLLHSLGVLIKSVPLNRICILYLHSWTFQEPLCGHFNMINVGIWHP